MNQREYKLYAMDTFFYNSLGSYPFAVRCEMLRELGYDATYLTLWDEQAWRDLELVADVQERYGLKTEAVYVTLDIAQSPDHPEAARILGMLERLQGCNRVELALTSSGGLKPSDPAGDDLALEWLRRLLAVAEARHIRISLYHHIYFWMERWEDALRLMRRLPHPLLGMTFSSFHWFAAGGQQLREAAESCLPHLHAINICGSRKLSEPGGLPASIECIDRGELDLFAFLRIWTAGGYTGPIGFQGYGLGGDVYDNLERNKRFGGKLLERLAAHPGWTLNAT